MFHVIFSDQFWGKDLISWFPCVVRCGVAFPFDQILKSPSFPKVAMIDDFFDFELLEVVHEVWRGLCKVGPLL